MQRRKFTDQEVLFIEQHYGTMPIKEIASNLNRSYTQIVKKAHKMGLNSKVISGESWSAEEDAIVKEHFEYAPKNRLVALLPNRTWCSILQRGLKTHNLRRISQDRYDVDYKFFENWTAENAYVFGFIAADGHLKSRKECDIYALQFELAGYDRDVLEKIKKVMSFEGPICETKRGTVKLQINNAKIIDDLVNKGIPIKNKTFDLEWPSTLPEEFYRDFVRGLVDGDGSIFSAGMHFLGTEPLLRALKKRLPCDTSTNTIHKRKNVNVYCLKLAKGKGKTVLDWLYKDATIFLDRKHQKYICFFSHIVYR